MSTPTPELTPDLRHFGYRSRVDGALANLRRELDEAARALAVAQAAVAEGRADTHALRRLSTAASEARVYGGAGAGMWRPGSSRPRRRATPTHPVAAASTCSDRHVLDPTAACATGHYPPTRPVATLPR